MNNNVSAPAHTRLTGLPLLAIRLAWFAVLLFALVSVAAGAPGRYAQLQSVSPAADTVVGQLRPDDARQLVQSGLAVDTYALYFTAAELLTALVSLGVAGLIAWGRSDDWMALFMSFILITAATALPVAQSLATTHPQWGGVTLGWRIAFLASLQPMFFLFPDGRFVPRWTRWPAAAWVGYMLLAAIFPQLQPPVGFGRGLTLADLLPVALVVIGFVAGLLAQFWRYFRVSPAIARQRTRWVVFGNGLLFLFFLLGVSVLSYVPLASPGFGLALARLAGPTLILFGLQAIAVSIGLSILRYHLWDIDVIIRRTLVYALLSSALVLAYLTSIIVLQSLLRLLTGADQSPVVTVISTLAIAALFGPLRARVQTFIDRRFYRRKFDAARTLAGFAATARDETNLDQLSANLVHVVAETMQPDRVSLWLRKNNR